MPLNGLILCLCVLLFGYEVKSQVCTRTIVTFVETFTVSGDIIKNRDAHVPTYNIVKYCCPGYYTLNPHEEASSANCLPLCKKTCKVSECTDTEQCVCPEKYVKDTTGTLCIPKCPPEQIFVDHSCRPKLTVSSSNNLTDVHQESDKHNSRFEFDICRSHSSSANIFYMSVGANVILFLIILVLLMKIVYQNRKKGDGKSNDNMSEGRNAQYTDMSGTHRNNLVEPPQYEYIQEHMSECPDSQYVDMGVAHRNTPAHEQNMTSECRESPYINMGGDYQNNLAHKSGPVRDAPCYEYVQMPLPIHIGKV